MKDFYLTLGAYDIITVAEAPNDAVVSRFFLARGSFGYIRTTTLKAFSKRNTGRSSAQFRNKRKTPGPALALGISCRTPSPARAGDSGFQGSVVNLIMPHGKAGPASEKERGPRTGKGDRVEAHHSRSSHPHDLSRRGIPTYLEKAETPNQGPRWAEGHPSHRQGRPLLSDPAPTLLLRCYRLPFRLPDGKHPSNCPPFPACGVISAVIRKKERERRTP